MSRNNEERLGIKNIDSDPPLDPSLLGMEENSSPSPLSFATPTEFVELPSKGKSYPQGHPLYNKEEVEIRFMTAKDEDILSSRTLLKKGIAIDRLIQNILVDKSIKVDNLLIGDKNAIIIASRVTGFGSDYETKVRCPMCSEHLEYSFDLDECKAIEPNYEDLQKEGVTLTEDGTYTFELPRTKATVEVKLLTGADEKKLAKWAEKKKKFKLPESPLIDQLKMIIVSVEDNKDGHFVESFIENMPALDARYFRKIYDQISPNVDMKQQFECNVCDYEGDLEVPLTSDFFWPK